MDANDLIELSGGGVTTLWQFPSNTTNCPVSNCEMAFGTRSLAIDHFKNQHAEHSIYCPLCDKPLTVHQFFDLFKSHYNQMHPNHTTPYDLYAENESTSETFQSNVDKVRKLKEERILHRIDIPFHGFYSIFNRNRLTRRTMKKLTT